MCRPPVEFRRDDDNSANLQSRIQPIAVRKNRNVIKGGGAFQNEQQKDSGTDEGQPQFADSARKEE
jgi:hypothetical protein